MYVKERERESGREREREICQWQGSWDKTAAASPDLDMSWAIAHH
jgi:hypothetical protein